MEKRKDKNKFFVNISNKETILDFVDRKLSENASIRELMKDETIRFSSPRDYLYFKFCPGYFGMCPNSKKEKDSMCNAANCWEKRFSSVFPDGFDNDYIFFYNLVKDTITPSICYSCGSSNVELEWQDEGYLAKIGLINFADIAYIKCNSCKKRYMSHADNFAIEFIVKLFLAKPSKHSPIKPGKTVVLPKDKVGLEIFIKHLNKVNDIKEVFKKLDPFSVASHLGELDLSLAVSDFLCDYYGIEFSTEEDLLTDEDFEKDFDDIDIKDLFDDFEDK
ncbi:hypothetical protein [Caldicellulosiruptor naganoensis]|uniref:Uncharacterized protein n=1 Tax=Caldicellulosiruptor naganoensis TaxID=29324 RepID=A0ABY7BFK4_9FIRM|nr:hypothetical protein [Caldicellulosiruptor naganoensis]WAM31593.1 hypothetical protein OTJ99_000017 [Caldicellulosiruptor naganoensis]